MNKYFLTFCDKNIEKQYLDDNKQTRISRLISFVQIEICFCIIIVSYNSLTNFEVRKLFEILSALVLLPIIALIKRFIPKILEIVLILMYFCFNILFVELINFTKHGVYFDESSIALIIPLQLLQATLLLTKGKWIYCSLFNLLGNIYLIVRLFDFSFSEGKDQIILGIFISFFSFCYMSYKQEKTNREYFKSIYESHKSLTYFKLLLQNIIPSPIFIINYNKNIVEFLNKSALKMLKKNNFIIDSDDENINLTVSRLENDLRFKLYEQMIDNFKITDNEIDNLSKTKNLNEFIRDYYSKNNFENGESFQSSEEIEFITINLKKINMHLDTEPTIDKNNMTSLENIDKMLYYELKVAKIHWEDKLCLLLLLTDTTTIKKIAELKNIDQYKTRLLATVSHDLRTPLNGIIGIIDLSMMQIKEKEIIDNLSIALNSANLLLYMINDILDFSQISYKKIRLNFERININELIKEIVNMIDYQIKRKALEFIYEININSNLVLISDGNRIKQILLNLLSNALKFTKKGYIKLKVEELFDLLNGMRYKFSVEDTGIGIKEEDQGKLFQLFGKLDQDDPEINKTGIGLGLTISQSLSKLLLTNSSGEKDGGISVKSTYGKGSLFSFEINSQLDQDEENIKSAGEECKKTIMLNACSIVLMDKMKGPDNASTKSRSKDLFKYIKNNQKYDKKILIIDDDLINLLIAQKYMEFFNLNFLTASNGLEGFQIIENQVKDNNIDIGLILMDCNMPVLDGYKATEKIIDLLNSEGENQIPIIGVTANVASLERDRCFEAGMKFVLTKPVKRKELEKLIEEILKIKLPLN